MPVTQRARILASSWATCRAEHAAIERGKNYMDSISRVRTQWPARPYLVSFLKREKRFEARLLREDGCCNDEVLDKADVTTEEIDFECTGLTLGVGPWTGWPCFWPGSEARVSSGRALRMGDHCFPKRWSLEVREGAAEVKLVDSVSWEWMDREER